MGEDEGPSAGGALGQHRLRLPRRRPGGDAPPCARRSRRGEPRRPSGLPRPAGAGRRPMKMAPAELEAMIIYQVGALAGMAAAEGGRHPRQTTRRTQQPGLRGMRRSPTRSRARQGHRPRADPARPGAVGTPCGRRAPAEGRRRGLRRPRLHRQGHAGAARPARRRSSTTTTSSSPTCCACWRPAAWSARAAGAADFDGQHLRAMATPWAQWRARDICARNSKRAAGPSPPATALLRPTRRRIRQERRKSRFRRLICACAGYAGEDSDDSIATCVAPDHPYAPGAL